MVYFFMVTVQSLFVDDGSRLKPLDSTKVAETCKKEDFARMPELA